MSIERMVSLAVRLCWVLLLTLFIIPPLLLISSLCIIAGTIFAIYEHSVTDMWEMLTDMCGFIRELYRWNPYEGLS